MIDLTHHKQQLVDCIRMLEHTDVIDYNGHASIKVDDQHLLINQGNCQRSQLTLDDIVLINFDGELVDGVHKPPLEFHLHVGIYRRRADVGAIVHAHPRWSTFLTMTGHPYLPVYFSVYHQIPGPALGPGCN